MADRGLMIGPCREADLTGVLALEREAFTPPHTEAQFRHELSLPLSTVLVARGGEGDGAVLGYLIYWLVCDEMHLQHVAVRSGRRREGIGSRLMTTALRQARHQGAARATLEVRRGNAGAQAFYAAFGFTCAGVRKGYYSEEGEDALIFWADLAEPQRMETTAG